MKRKALAIVLTLLMLVSVLPMGAFAASYTDTEGHWAEKSIDRWTEAKVLEGMGNNTFAPDEFLTRAQAMTVFSRLLNLTEKADISSLTDVAADAWYAPYIETGYAYQIIKGTSDTTFDPSGNITREQFFSVFARAVGIPPASTCDKTFTDLDQVSSWFVEEGTVYSMINRGYLNGYPDGSLKPQQYITRAEVAKVLDNAISDYITEDGTYPISGDGIVVVLAKNVKLTGNFNGHIVSSCPDSTLDLSGLNGTPYVYVLGDNTKIISAKPGTKVAVNPAADNVTANGVKVTYNPYVPSNPYIVPSVGGGGGGGIAYKVTAVISAPFDKTPIMVSTTTSRNTVADAMSALATAAKNDSGIVNTVNSAFEKIADKIDKDGPLIRHVGGFEIETTATATSASIKVTEGGLKTAMDSITKDYLDKNTVAASEGGLNKAQADAFNALVAVFTPNTLFTIINDNQMDFLSADQYRAKVAAAFDAMAKIAESGMTQAQFDALVARGSYIPNFLNNFTYGAMSTDQTLLEVTADFDDTTGNKFITAINDVFGADINKYPVLAAIAESGFHHADWIQGTYTATVEFDAP